MLITFIPGSKMKITKTCISGVVVIETTKFLDPRGEFARLYCDEELSEVIGSRRIVQVNHSKTITAGTIRGLHYQKSPYAEMKLIRCLKGRVWDVAVDLRAGSPTFLQWHAEELSAENMRMIVIPEGCAHGVQILEEGSELLYLHTEFYTPNADGRVRYNDPMLNINWPLEAGEMSIPDREQPNLTSNFSGLIV
jgi:dTDP-4-dehydrorhamnose 3,5-epimerase